MTFGDSGYIRSRVVGKVPAQRNLLCSRPQRRGREAVEHLIIFSHPPNHNSSQVFGPISNKKRILEPFIETPDLEKDAFVSADLLVRTNTHYRGLGDFVDSKIEREGCFPKRTPLQFHVHVHVD